MRLYRLLRVCGAVALLAAAVMAAMWLPAPTLPEMLRIAAAGVPALALLLLGQVLRRAERERGHG
ncbi:hypothetical protein [Roseicella aquatilis]|uniref:Uncharacterized protein n=1 Tax=Roseicella aquatilis TaxID=2527868 RepID=A0A4R4DQI2_9PROT|nr:hypothetical protein [Roseicella aquatilis]TCZ64374.1 hypothetical protein EXY23_06935 [Roseicella aquatilis]